MNKRSVAKTLQTTAVARIGPPTSDVVALFNRCSVPVSIFQNFKYKGLLEGVPQTSKDPPRNTCGLVPQGSKGALLNI